MVKTKRITMMLDLKTINRLRKIAKLACESQNTVINVLLATYVVGMKKNKK